MGETGRDTLAGGAFVIPDSSPERIVTPEDFTEEQRMLADSTRAFVEGGVLPRDEEIEKLDYELTVQLKRKAGELRLKRNIATPVIQSERYTVI